MTAKIILVLNLFFINIVSLHASYKSMVLLPPITKSATQFDDPAMVIYTKQDTTTHSISRKDDLSITTTEICTLFKPTITGSTGIIPFLKSPIKTYPNINFIKIFAEQWNEKSDGTLDSAYVKIIIGSMSSILQQAQQSLSQDITDTEHPIVAKRCPTIKRGKFLRSIRSLLPENLYITTICAKVNAPNTDGGDPIITRDLAADPISTEELRRMLTAATSSISTDVKESLIRKILEIVSRLKLLKPAE